MDNLPDCAHCSLKTRYTYGYAWKTDQGWLDEYVCPQMHPTHLPRGEYAETVDALNKAWLAQSAC